MLPSPTTISQVDLDRALTEQSPQRVPFQVPCFLEKCVNGVCTAGGSRSPQVPKSPSPAIGLHVYPVREGREGCSWCRSCWSAAPSEVLRTSQLILASMKLLSGTQRIFASPAVSQRRGWSGPTKRGAACFAREMPFCTNCPCLLHGLGSRSGRPG